jgi:excisionase family DNA binding protein
MKKPEKGAKSLGEKLYSLVEAAELLGLSPATLRRQAIKDKLRAIKIGSVWVVTKSEVDRYGKENKGRGRRTDLSEPGE